MGVNLIFKIAAVGILVSVICQVLKHSGREEQAFLTSLAGLILVPQLGFLGACFSNPMAWVAADLFLIPAYIHVRRKLNRQFGQEASATFFNPLAYLFSDHRLKYRLPLLPRRKAE